LKHFYFVLERFKKLLERFLEVLERFYFVLEYFKKISVSILFLFYTKVFFTGI
jgi:hypothetical protein